MKVGSTREFAKARLVAQVFTEQEGIDYNKTFSPAIWYNSAGVFIAVVA